MAKKGRGPIPKEDIIEALEANGAFLTNTAKALGISLQGLIKRIANNPDLKAKVEEINERKLDFTESKLMKLIRQGNLGAICFHLKCKGKHRGWVERHELTGPEGKALEHKLYVGVDDSGYPEAD